MGDMLTMAAISGASSAVNAIGDLFKINQQKKAQSELQHEQNEFQSTENETDRDWQAETWLQHFLMENAEYSKRLGLQQNQWQSQFDITNAYNAPSAQMARLRSAGINPSAMMQNSGLASLGLSSGSPSSSSSVQPSTASMASHGVSPAPAPSFGGLSSTAANFSSIAQMADSVSKLQQVGLNSDRQKVMLQVEMDKALSEAALNQQKTILARIETGVANNWLDKKAAAEYQKLVSDSYAAFTAGDLNKANELVAKANERLVSLQSEIKAEMFPQELANLKALENVYKSERSKNYAAANASNASAESSKATADEIRQRTGFDKELFEYRRQGLQNDNVRQILENGNLANEVLEVMQDYDWNLEALEQSENVRPIVKKFVGFIRTITRQSVKPVSDIVRGILKK